jgi:hypothetical protein
LVAILGIINRFSYIAISPVPLVIDAANPITEKSIELAAGAILAPCPDEASFTGKSRWA